MVITRDGLFTSAIALAITILSYGLEAIKLVLLAFWGFRTYSHRAAASAANAGLWWCLGMGLGPIVKRYHSQALATDAATVADAAAWCGYNFMAFITPTEQHFHAQKVD